MADNDTQVWKNESGVVYGQISPPNLPQMNEQDFQL